MLGGLSPFRIFVGLRGQGVAVIVEFPRAIFFSPPPEPTAVQCGITSLSVPSEHYFLAKQSSSGVVVQQSYPFGPSLIAAAVKHEQRRWGAFSFEGRFISML